jgi:hypothetical protein
MLRSFMQRDTARQCVPVVTRNCAISELSSHRYITFLHIEQSGLIELQELSLCITSPFFAKSWDNSLG